MSLHVVPGVCFSEVAVCASERLREGHESDRGSKTPLQSRCPSICADHSLLCPLFFSISHTHLHIYTFTQRHLLQGSMTLLSENEKIPKKCVKAKEKGTERKVEGRY